MRTLVLGGVRSGKSRYAGSLLDRHSEVRFLIPGSVASPDAEWVARVTATPVSGGAGPESGTGPAARAQRRVAAAALTGALREDCSVPTLIDDLGLWLAGTLDRTGAWSDTAVDLAALRDELCSAVADYQGELVVVSPEAGLAVVPPTPAGRRFQEELGALNSALAAVVDRAVLIVAGQTVALTPASATEAGPAPAAESTAVAPAGAVVAATAPSHRGTGHSPGSAPLPDPADAELFDAVLPPAAEYAAEARKRLAARGFRAGSLGRVEELGAFVAAAQGDCPPSLNAPALVLFAGDHRIDPAAAPTTDDAPVADAPVDDAARAAEAIRSGTAPVAVAARRCGAEIHLIDISAEREPVGAVTAYRIRAGSGGAQRGTAATTAETRQALAVGRQVADELVDAGADLLLAGHLGSGASVPAAALVATLLGREPVEVAPRADGTDDAGWCRQTAAIRDAMRHARVRRHHPLDLLAAVAGPDLAALTGFLAQAALRRTPVVLDDLVVVAAALLADEMAPGSRQWWLAGHRSAEPAQTAALERLDLTAAADLGLTVGGGIGAVLAVPLIGTAVDLLAEPAG